MLKNARLNHINILLLITVQPVFVGRKINQDPKEEEEKPQIEIQQCVVYRFQCDLRDAGYVGYTRGHLHIYSIYKHYQDKHGKVLEDLMKRFDVLKKCKYKFGCLLHEMLFIIELNPTLNVQSDSVGFILLFFTYLEVFTAKSESSVKIGYYIFLQILDVR